MCRLPIGVSGCSCHDIYDLLAKAIVKQRDGRKNKNGNFLRRSLLLRRSVSNTIALLEKVHEDDYRSVGSCKWDVENDDAVSSENFESGIENENMADDDDTILARLHSDDSLWRFHLTKDDLDFSHLEPNNSDSSSHSSSTLSVRGIFAELQHLMKGGSICEEISLDPGLESSTSVQTLNPPEPPMDWFPPLPTTPPPPQPPPPSTPPPTEMNLDYNVYLPLHNISSLKRSLDSDCSSWSVSIEDAKRGRLS